MIDQYKAEYETLRDACHAAYHKWETADKAWMRELQAIFGEKAYDARYSPDGAGSAKSKLRKLHDEFMTTGDAWRYANAELQAFKSLRHQY